MPPIRCALQDRVLCETPSRRMSPPGTLSKSSTGLTHHCVEICSAEIEHRQLGRRIQVSKPKRCIPNLAGSDSEDLHDLDRSDFATREEAKRR